MGRVSLTEDYDDRSVISKLNEMDKRVTENTTVVTAAEASAKASAQSAQETADRFAGSVGAVVQNANQQINASKAQVDQAKAEVDETVTTVAQAVQTANDASASAQASAQTVAGYENRVTALETADGQNVKLSGNQNITGIKTVPTEATGTRSQQIANSAKVGAELDNYAPMVRTTDNQMRIAGDKGFLNSLTALPRNIFSALGWTNIFDINKANNVYVFIMVSASNVLLCHIGGSSSARVLVIGNTTRPYPDAIKVAHNQVTDTYEVWFNALYGAWVRGYMISEGTGNGVGSPSNYTVKNIRGSEPMVGETYDSIVVSTRWDVVT